ncbi:MAG TPA: hypothetical protein VJ761_02940 [Ktedonobacteraceae bacterium]|nr:hypothetical protein [Ktedonobacteraceae bacterium]
MILPGEVPLLVLSWNDVQACDQVLRGYLASVRRPAATSSGGGQESQIQVLERLRERLAVLLAAGEDGEGLLLFTLPELQALEAAVRGFRRLIVRQIPASPAREGVLESLLRLQQDLTLMLSPYTSRKSARGRPQARHGDSAEDGAGS